MYNTPESCTEEPHCAGGNDGPDQTDRCSGCKRKAIYYRHRGQRYEGMCFNAIMEQAKLELAKFDRERAGYIPWYQTEAGKAMMEAGR
jgi:hypothetical protein